MVGHNDIGKHAAAGIHFFDLLQCNLYNGTGVGQANFRRADTIRPYQCRQAVSPFFCAYGNEKNSLANTSRRAVCAASLQVKPSLQLRGGVGGAKEAGGAAQLGAHNVHLFVILHHIFVDLPVNQLNNIVLVDDSSA